MWFPPLPMSPSGHGAAGGEGSEQRPPAPEPGGCRASGPGVCGHRRAPHRSVMGGRWRPRAAEAVACHMRAQEEKRTPHTGSLSIAYSAKGRGMLPPSRDTARQAQEVVSSPVQGCPTVTCTTTMHTPSRLTYCGCCAWCLPGPSAQDPSLEFMEATGRRCDARATVWGPAVAQWAEHSAPGSDPQHCTAWA